MRPRGFPPLLFAGLFLLSQFSLDLHLHGNEGAPCDLDASHWSARCDDDCLPHEEHHHHAPPHDPGHCLPCRSALDLSTETAEASTSLTPLAENPEISLEIPRTEALFTSYFLRGPPPVSL